MPPENINHDIGIKQQHKSVTSTLGLLSEFSRIGYTVLDIVPVFPQSDEW